MITEADYYLPNNTDNLLQGDIFRNVILNYEFFDRGKEIEIVELTFPYVIILSQSCDIYWMDNIYKEKKGVAKKHMLSALVAPIYEHNIFKTGQHLSELNKYNILELDFKDQFYNSKERELIENDMHYRFHLLKLKQKDSFLLPESVIDFKHYFSTPISYLYEKKHDRVCRLCDLYSEQIAIKFSNYLSRVGFPPTDIPSAT